MAFSQNERGLGKSFFHVTLNHLKECFMKKNSFLLFSLIFLAACTTSSSRLNNVSVGMARDEVIQKLGKPASTSASKDVEFLNYVFFNGLREQPYYVRLREGKVDAFGKVGDYPSSKDPSVDIHLSPRNDR